MCSIEVTVSFMTDPIGNTIFFLLLGWSKKLAIENETILLRITMKVALCGVTDEETNPLFI